MHQPFRSALFDEVDSILIDKARIPLVIAGGDIPPPELAYQCAAIVRALRRIVDFGLDEYARNVHLTDAGAAKAKKLFAAQTCTIPATETLLTAILGALHAEFLLRRDIDYLVKDNAIEPVDEFKGRIAENRRWSAGLQAAVEAKESLSLKKQDKILRHLKLRDRPARPLPHHGSITMRRSSSPLGRTPPSDKVSGSSPRYHGTACMGRSTPSDSAGAEKAHPSVQRNHQVSDS